MRQYATPDHDATGVFLWLLLMKPTEAQKCDPTAGIAALADPVRTLTILKYLRVAKSTSWPSRIALMNTLTDRVLEGGGSIFELEYEALGQSVSRSTECKGSVEEPHVDNVDVARLLSYCPRTCTSSELGGSNVGILFL